MSRDEGGKSRCRVSGFSAFEPPVDLVEVAEHLTPQLDNLPVDLVEAFVDLVESAGNEVEALVDLLETPPEELDQLFILARGHGPMLIPGRGPTQVNHETTGEWRGVGNSI